VIEVRRWFRLGVTLGLLVGVAVAVRRYLQASRGAGATRGDAWRGSDTAWTPPAAPTPGSPAPGGGEDVGRPSAGQPSPDVLAAALAVDPALLAEVDELAPHAETGGPPAWVEPVDGACPPSHPVKVKLSSGIFHLPGMFAYERTKPDRCYRDADSAGADGFTRAKR